MDDIIQTLQAGNPATLKGPGLFALKVGPFPLPVRLVVRAYSNHYHGGGQSTAWMKLYYDGELVGDHAGSGDPIPLQIVYEVGLAGNVSAAFRLDTGNRISTIENFGFEVIVRAL